MERTTTAPGRPGERRATAERDATRLAHRARQGAARAAAAPRRALQQASWPPAVAGPALGALNALSMGTSGRPLGVTTAFEDAAALLLRQVAPGVSWIEAYFEDRRDDPPELGWEQALVAGVFAGSWGSARLSGRPAPDPVPERWRRRFGPSRASRYGGAFLGGALLMLGARAARGCTSGHGISGTAQLASSSFLFDATFFAAGVAVAQALFRRGGER